MELKYPIEVPTLDGDLLVLLAPLAPLSFPLCNSKELSYDYCIHYLGSLYEHIIVYWALPYSSCPKCQSSCFKVLNSDWPNANNKRQIIQPLFSCKSNFVINLCSSTSLFLSFVKAENRPK